MEERKELNFKLIIQLIVIIVIIYVAFTLLKKLGLIKSGKMRQASKAIDEQKAAKKTIKININTSELFDPKLHLNASKNKLLDVEKAKNIAHELYGAFGIFNDNEEKVFALFRSLTNKFQISQIAFYFQAEFNKDLANFLINNLNKNELLTIQNIINKLS